MNKTKTKLFGFTDFFENNGMFLAARQGLTVLIPLIVVGSMALMLKGFPVPVYQEFLQTFCDGLVLVILEFTYYVTFQFLSIYMVIAISYKYAVNSSNISSDSIFFPLISTVAFIALTVSPDTGLDMNTFGNKQMFSAVVTALLVSKMMITFRKYKAKKSKYLMEGMDETLSVAVKTILPATGIVLLFVFVNIFIRKAFGVDSIQGLFEILANTVFNKLGNGFLSLLAFILSVQVMWFFGIHGNNVLENIAQTHLNVDGIHIFSKSFYDVFVIMGGCGSVLCLIIAILIFSKNQNVKSIAKLASAPCIFNISEIIIIGLPVLFNPIFLIPFLLVPIVNGAISFFATFLGIIPIVSNSVEWTTPVIISGYYATGSFKGSVLQIVCLVVGVLIYLPFLKLYEERMRYSLSPKIAMLTEEFKQSEKYQAPIDFLYRNDELGVVAKTLATELRKAITNREIFWVYQPQVNRNGECVGAEALVRWFHPIAGYIYPPLIIALAKEKNLLFLLEKQLLDDACKLIHDLEEKNENISISINLTAESLMRMDMEEMIAEAVNTYSIQPCHLWFELTEQAALSSTDEVFDKLLRLNEKGHKLLIDDFGMGHTSLLYLQTNKFDVVKLDGSLIRSILENNRNYNIISSIVYLGRSLKFDIIAEYVENEEQKEKLDELGCDGFQGYLFSKPLKTEDFKEYLKSNKEFYENFH